MLSDKVRYSALSNIQQISSFIDIDTTNIITENNILIKDYQMPLERIKMLTGLYAPSIKKELLDYIRVFQIISLCSRSLSSKVEEMVKDKEEMRALLNNIAQQMTGAFKLEYACSKEEMRSVMFLLHLQGELEKKYIKFQEAIEKLTTQKGMFF